MLFCAVRSRAPRCGEVGWPRCKRSAQECKLSDACSDLVRGQRCCNAAAFCGNLLASNRAKRLQKRGAAAKKTGFHSRDVYQERVLR